MPPTAQQLLERLAGPGAVLRPDQAAAIDAIVTGRRRTLVVQRTGWGKSAVYFIATALLRADGAGPTLLVSPLLALMRDQITAARRIGIAAETINSANPDDWDAIQVRLAAGELDLLCISPERLNSPGFRDDVLPKLADTVGMLCVDEAHCISDWGHDFRPDYRRIADLLGRLGDTPVLACTATANDRVIADVEEQLGGVPLTLRGSLDRESLALSVVTLAPAERLAYLAQLLTELPGSGIIYTLTVAETARVATFLADVGHPVAAYSSDVEPAERERLEAALKANELKAVVATSALGMGFDKPDVAFAIHYGMPSSPIAYYQQVGRAGRALPHAEAVLLPGPEDTRIWRFFEQTSFPPEPLVRAALDTLAEAGGTMSLPALESAVNLGRSRLETLLKILDVDGAVERVRGGYRATGVPWRYDTARLGRLAAARRAEADAMVEYAATTGCRMEYLRRCLDDPGAVPCGRCDNCTGARRGLTADAGRARDYLRSVDVIIPARKAWPRGTAGGGLPTGNIAAARRAAGTRALSRDGDGGWSDAVAAILAGELPLTGDDPAAAEVIAGFAAMLRRWDWAARPTWVTPIPSARRPGLTEALAATIADLGKLTYLPVLARAKSRPPQSQMGNSAHQLANVWDAFRVDVPDGGLPAGPLLLVDDTTGSGWTIAAVAARLTDAGAGTVLPAVLLQRR